MLRVMHAYERFARRALDLDRVMAWHVLTVLGDALWRTEAGVELPGPGGSAETWVDDLAIDSTRCAVTVDRDDFERLVVGSGRHVELIRP